MLCASRAEAALLQRRTSASEVIPRNGVGDACRLGFAVDLDGDTDHRLPAAILGLLGGDQLALAANAAAALDRCRTAHLVETVVDAHLHAHVADLGPEARGPRKRTIPLRA